MNTFAAVDAAAVLIKEIKVWRYDRAKLAEFTEPTAYGALEGGRKDGKPIGGKLPLTFKTEAELEAVKLAYDSVLEERIRVAVAALFAMGVEECGDDNALKEENGNNRSAHDRHDRI